MEQKKQAITVTMTPAPHQTQNPRLNERYVAGVMFQGASRIQSLDEMHFVQHLASAHAPYAKARHELKDALLQLADDKELFENSQRFQQVAMEHFEMLYRNEENTESTWQAWLSMLQPARLKEVVYTLHKPQNSEDDLTTRVLFYYMTQSTPPTREQLREALRFWDWEEKRLENRIADLEARRAEVLVALENLQAVNPSMDPGMLLI